MVDSEGTRRRCLDIDGFVQLPAFVTEREIAELRAAVAEIVGTCRDGACERPHNTLLPLTWRDDIVDLLLADPARIDAIRAATEAQDLRWISGYVSIKEPRTPPLWWHQDWWCWSHQVTFRRAAPQVALLLYLTDTNPSNGALRVLPGSHRRSGPLHALLPEAHGSHAEQLALDHPALADLPDQVTLPARAGDAVALDYRLLHGTHANASDARRDALLLTFAPSWRDLPEDLRGHLIDHPALPTDEVPAPRSTWHAELLPRFDGVRATLALDRDAPAEFATA